MTNEDEVSATETVTDIATCPQLW